MSSEDPRRPPGRPPLSLHDSNHPKKRTATYRDPRTTRSTFGPDPEPPQPRILSLDERIATIPPHTLYQQWRGLDILPPSGSSSSGELSGGRRSPLPKTDIVRFFLKAQHASAKRLLENAYRERAALGSDQHIQDPGKVVGDFTQAWDKIHHLRERVHEIEEELAEGSADASRADYRRPGVRGAGPSGVGSSGTGPNGTDSSGAGPSGAGPSRAGHRAADPRDGAGPSGASPSDPDNTNLLRKPVARWAPTESPKRK